MLAAAGPRSQSVRDFFLHHEHDGLEISPVCEEPQQNVGSNEIRKVAYDLHLLRLMIHPRTRTAGLGSKERVEIDSEDVAFDDFDVRGQRKLHAQLGCEDAIEFNRDYA